MARSRSMDLSAYICPQCEKQKRCGCGASPAASDVGDTAMARAARMPKLCAVATISGVPALPSPMTYHVESADNLREQIQAALTRMSPALYRAFLDAIRQTATGAGVAGDEWAQT